MAYSYKTKKWWQDLLTGGGLLGALGLDPLDQYLYEGFSTGNWNPTKDPSEDDFTDQILADLEARGVDFAGMSQSEIEGILDKYWEEDAQAFSTEHSFDIDRLVDDYGAMYDAVDSRPEAPLMGDYLDAARAQAYGERDAALAELDNIYNQRVGMYDDEMRSMASGYNNARAGILSNQYAQNAQLMDNMTSQMDKANRNALEAGASAGVRLANNVNTLLSTQNQQSRQSLETANQLAQMMVNQRNAEASVRGQYGDYMNQTFNTRQNIRNSAESKAQSYADANYGAAKNDYDIRAQRWDDRYGSNPLWEAKGLFSKSKYNNTGG